MRKTRAARVAIAFVMIFCAVVPSRSECAELKRPPALPGEQAAVDFVLDLKGSGGVDESGHIEWIDLTINQATDERLAAIRGLKHLKRLELTSNSIGDAGLEIIASCPNLTELDLQGTKITDAGLAKLAVLKRLEKLDLSHTDIGDEGFLALGELPELRALDLASTKVGDAGLALLGRSPKLRSLELRRLNTKPDDSEKVTLCEAALNGRPGLITDQGLKNLAGCAALEYLGLSGAQVTDEGLRHLAGLKKLAKLELSSTPIGGRGLAHLQTLTQLRELYLDFTEFGPSGAAAVGKLKQLTLLSLDETPTTDAMLIPLAELTALRELFLRATKISNAGIVRLGPLFRLHQIEADGTAVDDSGNKLLATILPRCRMSYDAKPQTEEQQAAEAEQNGLFFKLFSGDQEAFRTGAAKYPTLLNRVYPIMFASVQMPFANFSPLSYAAHEDDLKTARFLIELGARPGVSVQNPLLHVRSTEMAELLIKHGAVIEPADDDDDSPLLYAQNAKLAELFLRHGADINRVSPQGRTPLHEAVELERFDVVRLLVERGADIDSKPLPRSRLGY